jgi:hypothetical protein
VELFQLDKAEGVGDVEIELAKKEDHSAPI